MNEYNPNLPPHGQPSQGEPQRVQLQQPAAPAQPVVQPNLAATPLPQAPVTRSANPQPPAQPRVAPPPPPAGRQTLNVGTQLVANPYVQQTPNIGDMIGPCRIQVLVGEGAMANVYKVWHEDLEVIRAIKILKNGFTKEMRDRFFTEAKILADIRHSNIIEIHTVGMWNQHVPYIEMEFIDGHSFKKLISQSGHIAPVAAIAMTYFVCCALQYAHIKDYTLYGKVYSGLIHRDIKPENIILSKDGVIKLMDFGIARPTEVSLHTVGEKIVGSLPYLSPEQLNGQTLDQRSDIYSLGTVLYEMLCGERVYPQKSISDIVRKKAIGQYKSLSEFELDIPKPLIAIVEKALKQDPHERYDSAQSMGRDLFALLRAMSDVPPQDILFQYSKSPSSPIAMAAVRPIAKSQFPLIPVLITAGVVAVVGVAAVIAKFVFKLF